MTKSPHVVVIGAGVGGLTAAIDLARQGCRVTVLERAAHAGGKVRQEWVDGRPIDAGPTVFTMRWLFDQLFDDAGALLEDYLTLSPATILARHGWAPGAQYEGCQLDLYADIDRSADEITAFAGKREADGYRRFCAESAATYKVLKNSFIENQRPSHLDVVTRVGPLNLFSFLAQIKPMQTMWAELGKYFHDPRMRQLFGRYATYVGSSPWSTPSTIMLVAHVEQEGVWSVQGGMHAVADALQKLGEAKGAIYRFNAHVDRIIVEGGRAAGAVLEDGEELAADAVVFNGDISAFKAGLLGEGVARAGKPTQRARRSLSAVTWCLSGETSGFPLSFHNVFFAENYEREFEAIFRDRTIKDRPTVYLCAQDRSTDEVPGGPERLFLLINAPADGDIAPMTGDDLADLQGRAMGLIEACGLQISNISSSPIVTCPDDFATRFPATGGALYGQASHGAFSTLARNGARTKVPGLYLAGGSVHPGAGVPMASLSGRLAAAQYIKDRADR